MLKKLNKYYLSQLFRPTILSVFINPFYFIRKRLYSEIKQKALLLQGEILDLGCGLKPYNKLFTGAKNYIGVDIENPGHDHSKEDIDVYYDGKIIPFNDSHFNGVFFSEVLEHVFEPEALVKEINRVLQKNGLLLLTTPFAWDEHEIPFDYGRYTTYGLRHLLEKCGFEIIEIKKTGHYTEVIIQYFINYLRMLLYTKNKYVNLLINICFIFPFTLLGIVFSFILPRKQTLYFNNIVLAKKL
jgi:SAM-dependent methyltransferase